MIQKLDTNTCLIGIDDNFVSWVCDCLQTQAEIMSPASEGVEQYILIMNSKTHNGHFQLIYV